MAPLVKNHATMREKILTGSPKKNAACWSFSNMIGGISPGSVLTCQSTKIAISRPACQRRRCFMNVLWSSSELLLIALEHLFAQHAPDRLVQFDESRRHAHLGHVTRAREVDREFADRMRGGAGAQANHAVAHRDRLVQIVRDEQPLFFLLGPQREHFVFHQL